LSADSECQILTCQGSPSEQRRDRDDDRRRIDAYMSNFPDGVPFVDIVGEVFDKKGTIEPDADYKFTERYVEDAEHLKFDRRDGDMLRVTPTPEFVLEPQLALGKTSVRDGDDEKLSFQFQETGNSGSNRYAKDRVRDYFKKKTLVDADSIRSWLLEELGTELRSISDKYNLLRHRDRDEYRPVPYRTRYNDLSRATSVLEGFQEAVSRASDRFFVGTFVTLTADPKRFDSRADAVDAVADGKSRFMSWLRNRVDAVEGTPKNLAVPEYQENGMLHFHVCLFGVTPSDLPTETDIRSYWNDRQDIGSQVHVKPLRRRRDGRWLLRDTEDGDNTDVSLRDYLTGAMYGLIRVANTDPSELLEAAEQGDVSLWKQALYWYTGRRYWSGSPSLTTDADADNVDADSLPYVPRWEYVGTFHRSELPARVFRSRDAAADDRPPPKEN
jgi:hypothetical protein